MILDKRIALFLALKRRYTLWTFIKYHERSKDPAHCRRVKRNMKAELDRRHREGEVIRCRSVGGRLSWRAKPAGEIPF